MRKLLGLKKTESYWLVHRNFFKTEIIGGVMWIDIDSFEKWYANQIKHKKVNGEAPGKELKKKEDNETVADDMIAETKQYISRQEAAELAGVTASTITKWMQMKKFTCTGAGKVLRIHRMEFLNWLDENREGVC